MSFIQDINSEMVSLAHRSLLKTFLFVTTLCVYDCRHLERLRHQCKGPWQTQMVHLDLKGLMKHCMVYSSKIDKTFFPSCGQSPNLDLSRPPN